jgi:hypothetical protein
MAPEPDQRITEVVEREQSRLRNFIRRRVPDPRDVEDILQEVFYELVEANRLLMPIDHVTGTIGCIKGSGSRKISYGTPGRYPCRAFPPRHSLVGA